MQSFVSAQEIFKSQWTCSHFFESFQTSIYPLYSKVGSPTNRKDMLIYLWHVFLAYITHCSLLEIMLWFLMLRCSLHSLKYFSKKKQLMNILEYCRVFCNVLKISKYFRIFVIILENFGIFWAILEYFRIFQILSKVSEVIS